MSALTLLTPAFSFSASPVSDPFSSGLQSMASGNLAQARHELEAASNQSPENPQICLALLELYSRIHEDSLRRDTSAHCRELAHRQNDWKERASIRNYLGKVTLADGNFTGAVAEYREAIRLDPYEENYRFDLAQTLLNHERFAEAAEALEDGCRVFDKSAQLQLALGVAYYGQRRFPEAVNSFLRTIDLAPDVVQPYVFLGKMIDQAGSRLQEVTDRFRAFQKNNPGNYLGGLLLAKALGASGAAPEERENLLRASIKNQADQWENHYELGVLLESGRNYPEAARELELSCALNREVAATHYHLARVYDRLHRPEAATHERELHQQLIARDKVTAGMEAIH